MVQRWMTRTMLVMILVGAMAMAGCANTDTTSTGEVPENPPAASTEAPAGEGAGQDDAQFVETKCTMCHDYQRVAAAEYDKAGWTDVVTRMQQNGLVVTEEEKVRIIDYLAAQ